MMLSFLVLAVRPSAEKKPPVALDPVESGADGSPIEAVECVTPASAG
jgi:hypothetical protein